MSTRADNSALEPSTALFLRLEAPPLPPRKLRAVLPALLSAELPFSVGDCVFRFGRRRPDGTVEAHVVRRSDLAAHLARLVDEGHHPRRVLPPAPALWRWALERQPLLPDAPRAVLFTPGLPGQSGFLATGHGALLDSVSSFRCPGGAAGEGPLALLRLAFRGLPDELTVFAVGAGAQQAANDLQGAHVRVIVPDSPETAIGRAVSAQGLDDLDFRIGEFADPASARRAAVPLLSASLAFFAASAFWAFSAHSAAARAEADRAAALAERSSAFERLAGRRLSTRGAAALSEAREEAAMRRDPAVVEPDCTALLPAALAAARRNGVAFSHVALSGSGLSASGTAPDAVSAQAFVSDARSAGLRTALPEPPRPNGSGRVDFFVHPGGGAVQEAKR